MPDAATSQVVVDIVLALIVGILGFYQWLSRKSQVNARHIKQLEQDLSREIQSHGKEIARLQAGFDHAPGRSDLKRIHERIDAQTACVSRMEGELHSVKGTLNMIHEYLLTREKS